MARSLLAEVTLPVTLSPGHLVTLSSSPPQPHLPHQPVGRLVRLAHPLDDLRRLRRVLQLDADGAVDAQRLDLAQVRHEIDDAAPRRQVAVDLAVAVAEVDVDRLALQPAQLLRGDAG